MWLTSKTSTCLNEIPVYHVFFCLFVNSTCYRGKGIHSGATKLGGIKFYLYHLCYDVILSDFTFLSQGLLFCKIKIITLTWVWGRMRYSNMWSWTHMYICTIAGFSCGES